MRNRYFKSILLAVVLAAILMTAVSCGNPIVGTWTNEIMGVESTLQFNANWTFTLSTLGMQAASGKYSVNGNQLTLEANEAILGAEYSSGTADFSVSGDQLNIGGMVYTRQK